MSRAVVVSAIKTIYSLMFDEIRLQAVNSIGDGDVSLALIKERIMTDLDRIQIKLRILSDEPINTAKTHLAMGLAYFSNGSIEEAKQQFRQASNNAIKGFHTASTFDKKVMAMKLMLLTILHLNNYFDESVRSETDLRNIRDLTTIAWVDFLALPEVTSAISTEFNDRAGSLLSFERFLSRIVSSSSKRRNILTKLAAIRSIVEQILETRSRSTTLTTFNADLVLIKPIIFTGHADIVRCLLIDRGRLFSCSWDHTIKVWDISTDPLPANPLIKTFVGHTYYVICMIIIGDRLYSASSDSTIKVWDISEPLKEDPLITTLQGHTFYTVSIVANRGRLYSASWDNTIKVWDISQDPIPTTALGTLEGHDSFVVSVAVHEDRLFSASWDHSIKIWDISSDDIPVTPLATISGHDSSVFHLLVSEGRLFSSSADMTVKMWDISGGQVPTAPMLTFVGHTGWACVSMVRGDRLFTGSHDNTIKIWDLTYPCPDASPPCLLTLVDHTNWVTCFASAGGKLYTGSADMNIHVRLL